MSESLLGLVAGRPGVDGKPRRRSLLEGIADAGQMVLGEIVGEPRWRGTTGVAMTVADIRTNRQVGVFMALGERSEPHVLATLLDLRAGEAVVVPGRAMQLGQAGRAEQVFQTADVSSARVDAAKSRGVAVAFDDGGGLRARDEPFWAAALRDLAPARDAEREMLANFQTDLRKGMSRPEAFTAAVGEYVSEHPSAPKGVMLMATRMLRSDVGLAPLAPESVAVEGAILATAAAAVRSAAAPAPAPVVKSARARDDGSWTREIGDRGPRGL